MTLANFLQQTSVKNQWLMSPKIDIYARKGMHLIEGEDTTSYTAPESDDIERLREIGEWTGVEDEEAENA